MTRPHDTPNRRQPTQDPSRSPARQPVRHSTREHGGRPVARLLADFGHDLPTRPPETSPDDSSARFRPTNSRGPRRPGRGWAPATAPVSQWRMTSDQAPALWPWVAGPTLPPTGAQMGIDELSGATFYCDPHGWVLDDTIPVTNPNIMAYGKPGGGKSANTKAFCLRMMDFGYRILVLGDPKDEYEALSRELGVQPFAIGHGLPTRINPLDFGPLGQDWALLPAPEARRRATIIFARWLTLIRGLVGSQRIGQARVPFSPSDERVVTLALTHLTGYAHGNTTLTETTIPHLWALLNNPTDHLVTECRYPSTRAFLDQTRLLRDSLAQLVTGALAALFDAHTTIDVDWRAPIQSLSLSRLEPLGDEAIGIALTCLNSWGRGMREVAAPTDRRIVIRDEVWKQMRLGPEAVKSFDADMRLSRSSGDIQFAISHKPSDPESAGDTGSQAATIGRDLLHLADIKILHGQDTAIAEDLGHRLGLNPIACDLIAGWARQEPGRALWLVGDQQYKVTTVLHPIERRLFYTNHAIEGTRPHTPT